MSPGHDIPVESMGIWIPFLRREKVSLKYVYAEIILICTDVSTRTGNSIRIKCDTIPTNIFVHVSIGHFWWTNLSLLEVNFISFTYKKKYLPTENYFWIECIFDDFDKNFPVCTWNKQEQPLSLLFLRYNCNKSLRKVGNTFFILQWL